MQNWKLKLHPLLATRVPVGLLVAELFLDSSVTAARIPVRSA